MAKRRKNTEPVERVVIADPIEGSVMVLAALIIGKKIFDKGQMVEISELEKDGVTVEDLKARRLVK